METFTCGIIFEAVFESLSTYTYNSPIISADMLGSLYIMKIQPVLSLIGKHFTK